ncbi:hypothetical protein [Bradyrhizobium manausense]|uniref:Uncharacterized protein n=1 Tax=Bradyrhizobium manausense TaxID=989370 RepID=A0A0R3DGA3_9BRAD|nr:hypothetical protein [Bradyrhizobium manausense]KRQ07373.1 hypothetical protein AOQ71_23835 [Bradyrhizobium manausense]
MRASHAMRPVRFTQLLLLPLQLLAPAYAYAGLSVDPARGEQTMQIPVPGRNAEICVVPKHLAAGKYFDKDSEIEIRLCNIDEHKNSAVCPKLNSTNPGLDLYSLPQGGTPEQVEAARCNTAGAHKIAKYKLSSSCSYTPSILGYYHLSRMLGGIADVPPAVLRTFDLQNHIALGRAALAETASNSLIHQTWASLMAQLTAGANGKRRDFLLTDDFTQSYGALSENPKHESFYKEFFNGGANNVARAVNFRDRNPVVQMLARNVDISTLVGRSFTTENVQEMVQLKDAADLIVLDTLMNQQDRFGNIHYLTTYYYLDAADPEGDGSPKLKSSKDLTPEEAARLGAVQLKKMLLKDNDCGVAKENIANRVGLADRIAHIDPKTYLLLQQFDAVADSTETKDFFVRELVFTADDYANVRRNLKDLAAKLHQACLKGVLKLDLDLQAHFSTQTVKVRSCEP